MGIYDADAGTRVLIPVIASRHVEGHINDTAELPTYVFGIPWLPRESELHLSETLIGRVERLAQEREPLQRIIQPVRCAVTIRPFVVAGNEHCRWLERVEIVKVLRIDFVVAKAITFLNIADVNYKRLVLLLRKIDIRY